MLGSTITGRYTDGMLIIKLDELRRRRALEWKRDISLRDIAKGAELSLNTVQRVKKNDQVERVSVHTLDRLCKFFKVTDISELVEYQPATEPQEKND